MSQTQPDETMIEDVNRMAGAEYCVCSDLQELHGVKSVAQSRRDYHVRVVAHDDYPILSNVQTVCAWHQCGFTVDSAGRVDGDIVVRFKVLD